MPGTFTPLPETRGTTPGAVLHTYNSGPVAFESAKVPGLLTVQHSSSGTFNLPGTMPPRPEVVAMLKAGNHPSYQSKGMTLN